MSTVTGGDGGEIGVGTVVITEEDGNAGIAADICMGQVRVEFGFGVSTAWFPAAALNVAADQEWRP